ncbi:MAG: hypothetical protein QOE71_1738, partial [Pseudonocardiales bacterium]|nr:hypothetical protein [Pseudonocardiales bacterium]
MTPRPAVFRRCTRKWCELAGLLYGLGVTAPTTQLSLDLVGVFVFALSGGLAAVRARLDLF